MVLRALKPHTNGYRVYLDTNILAMWLLYDEEFRTAEFNVFKPMLDMAVRFDRRINSALEILKYIKTKQFNARFVTSSWTMAELIQALVDDKIAFKILLSGHSLSHFSRLRQYERLSERQSRESRRQVSHLWEYLQYNGVSVKGSSYQPERIHKLVMKYGLDTTDAMHIDYCIGKCQYFITNDGDLVKIKDDIPKLRIMLPDEFLTEARHNGLIVNPSDSS